jgi:hypothetical protein
MADDTGPISRSALEAVGFFREVWLSLRPYLQKFIVDLCISSSLWIALYVFHSLTDYFSIRGWAGEFIVNIHSLGVVLAFVAFGILFTLDVVAIRADERDGGEK